MQKPYPILLDLSDKKVGVVGGGNVAARKVKGLLAAGADVTVVSPVINDRIDRQKKFTG
ncbi:NAD(P)-dependent oxidoreductase [Lentilactobacillus kisonensis]|uniref:NAD(P)-dependent oxidoreductase n=1 Tax=Lentilactobacillus kisonensis TaxID=481722 RepID=UPI000A9A2180|nr:NAD(P)-dependent oxidoreductase [Lentilactobacillus kisonensis]